jgi:hypothetical protein
VKPKVEIIKKHRPPAMWREFRAHVLGEREVDRQRLPDTHIRAAAVDQPISRDKDRLLPSQTRAPAASRCAGCW